MVSQIKLGDIVVDVVLKDIKNVYLSVYPPAGRVRITAPQHMNVDTVRVFAVSKLAWIQKQQMKLRDQERETIREYLDRESHYVWGKRYLLKIVEVDEAPAVELKAGKMFLRIRPGASAESREAVVSKWYREQLKAAIPDLLSKWEPIIGVRVERFFVQKMKTKWGSCNPYRRSIRLNTDLAKKPASCLEYILVHELTHLREKTHNCRFTELMDQFMPQWRDYREMLNTSPLTYERWHFEGGGPATAIDSVHPGDERIRNTTTR